MDDDENEDIFDCPICLTNYINPKLLKCSHTLCENCLNDIIKKGKDNPLCPICKSQININEIIDNSHINRIMNFYNSMNNCTDIFINFPLKFKYCSECKIFITNYSFKKHKKEKHILFSFDKVLQSFFEKKDNVYDKDILFVLFFYSNPFLHEIKYIKINGNALNLCNNKYIFFRNILDMKRSEENNFLIKLIKQKYVNPQDGRLFKGLLINKRKLLFIHGLFLIKVKDEEPLIEPTIFGFLNYEKIKFFGFIKINKEHICKNEEFEIKDIILKCGLLYNVNYYFGNFNNVNLSNIASKNENKNLLKSGEMLILEGDNNVEVKSIIEKTKTLEKSMKTEEKETFDPLKFNIEPFYIQENVPLDDYKLLNCKINLIDYGKTIIFDEDNYAMYILKTKNENNTRKNDNKDRTLFINFTNLTNNISQFIALINYQIKNTKEEKVKDEFNNNLKDILNIKVKTCQINYYQCEINSEGIKLNENIYFEISGNKVKQINKKNISENGKEFMDNKLNNINTIEDLLKIELTSELYNFKEKRREPEKLSCNCNLI